MGIGKYRISTIVPSMVAVFMLGYSHSPKFVFLAVYLGIMVLLLVLYLIQCSFLKQAETSIMEWLEVAMRGSNIVFRHHEVDLASVFRYFGVIMEVMLATSSVPCFRMAIVLRLSKFPRSWKRVRHPGVGTPR